MKRITRRTVLPLVALALAACDPLDPNDPFAPTDAVQKMETRADAVAAVGVDPATVAAISAMIESTNAALELAGVDFRLGMVEYLAHGDVEAGTTVLSKVVGDKQLGHDFVPNDPRRAAWSGPVTGGEDDITFAIDQSDGDPLGVTTLAEATGAIRAAMATWEQVTCSTLPLTEVSDGGFDLGFIAASNGLGGSFNVVADLQHAGFRDVNYAGNVLAATHTLIWVNTATGQPTDVDGNGLLDVAFREINYDPSWLWGIGFSADIETIALHEAGHGLSQGHFGTVFLKNDGSLMAAPRAVMNALYAGPFADLAGTDVGGHCGIWDLWPDA